MSDKIAYDLVAFKIEQVKAIQNKIAEVLKAHDVTYTKGYSYALERIKDENYGYPYDMRGGCIIIKLDTDDVRAILKMHHNRLNAQLRQLKITLDSYGIDTSKNITINANLV